MSPRADGALEETQQQDAAAETSTGSGPLPWDVAGDAAPSAIGAESLGADGGSSGDSADVNMMEQAEQMMAQMELAASSAAQKEQPQLERAPLGRSGSGSGRELHTAGALKLSSEDLQQRQTSNVFRVIRQQMRGDRSLYGQKLADAKRVFAL